MHSNAIGRAASRADSASSYTATTTDPTPIEDNERAAAAAAAALSTTNKKILDKSDPANMQFCDHWCWEVEDNAADPGQTVTLRKYDPIDVLQVSE